MEEFPFKKHGIIIYDNYKEIQEKAIYYGRKRTESNSNLHKVAPEYDRKEIADKVDELGVVAELIGSTYLEQIKIPFIALNIFEEKPIKSADVFIGDFKIDIKGVRHNNEELTVNRKAHYQKDVTHYWFIKPFRNENNELTGEAEYWIISAAYVTYWKSRESYTEYYYKSIVDINNIFENEK